MEVLRDLMQKNKINYLVSVDDCYSKVDSVEDKSILIDDMVSNLSKYKFFLKSCNASFNFELVVGFPLDIKRDYIQKFVDSLNTGELTRALELVDSSEKSLISERDKLQLFLEKVKEFDFIKEIKTFDSVESAIDFFKNDLGKMWTPSEDNKILWLIDRDFSSVGGNTNEGFKLLEFFLNIENKWNIGILATKNIEDIKTEKQLSSYLNDNFENLYKNRNLIWAIEKSLIDISYLEDFANRLSHGLRRNYTFKIITLLTNFLEEGLKTASLSFKNIAQSTINEVILNYSNREGVSIIETLSRVLHVYTRGEFYAKLSSDHEEISKLIWEFENLYEEPQNDEDKQDGKEIYKIRSMEKYNTYINKLHNPIGFGDIFSINGQHYILVSQTCDIALRGTGERKVQKAVLLKISDKKPQSIGNNSAKHYFELKYYDIGKPHYIYYKDAIQVDLDVLDICSFNSEGYAEVSLDELTTDFFDDHRFSLGLRKRLDRVIGSIRKEYEAYLSLNKDFSKVLDFLDKTDDENKDEIIDLIVKYKYVIDNNQQSNHHYNTDFVVSDNKIYYNVRRIKRLDELYTMCLCLEFNNYNSRIGLPFDIADGYEPRNYKVMVENPIYIYDSSEPKLIEVSEYTLHPPYVLSDQIIDEIICNECCVSNTELITEIKSCLLDNTIDQYIEIKKSSNEIIVKAGVFPIVIEDHGHYCTVVSNKLKVPMLVLRETCKKFITFIEENLENDVLFEKNRKLNMLIESSDEGVTLKDYVSFGNIDNTITFEIDGTTVVTMKFEILQTAPYQYKLITKIQEHEDNVKLIEQYY